MSRMPDFSDDDAKARWLAIMEHLFNERTPHPPRFEYLGSDPMPAVAHIIQVESLKVAANSIQNGDLRERVLASLNASLAADIDDICPSPPFPVPPRFTQAIAQLVLAAHSLAEGSLRDGLINVAGELLARGT